MQDILKDVFKKRKQTVELFVLLVLKPFIRKVSDFSILTNTIKIKMKHFSKRNAWDGFVVLNP